MDVIDYLQHFKKIKKKKTVILLVIITFVQNNMSDDIRDLICFHRNMSLG